MTFRSLTFGRGPGADVTAMTFDAYSAITAVCLGAFVLVFAALLVDAVRDRDWTLAAMSLGAAVVAGSVAFALGRTTLPWEAS